MPPVQRRQIQQIPDFDVLSEDMEQCAAVVKQRLETIGKLTNVQIIRHPALGEVIPKHIEIRVDREIIAFIYEPIACHNYNIILLESEDNLKKSVEASRVQSEMGRLPKEIRVATIDTMLSFYLAFLYADAPYYYKDRILCMAKFLFDVEQQNRLNQKGLLKRFSIDCYGKQPTLETIRAEKSEMFKKLKSQKNSTEYERWFLRYNPSETTVLKKNSNRVGTLKMGDKIHGLSKSVRRYRRSNSSRKSAKTDLYKLFGKKTQRNRRKKDLWIIYRESIVYFLEIMKYYTRKKKSPKKRGLTKKNLNKTNLLPRFFKKRSLKQKTRTNFTKKNFTKKNLIKRSLKRNYKKMGGDNVVDKKLQTCVQTVLIFLFKVISEISKPGTAITNINADINTCSQKIGIYIDIQILDGLISRYNRSITPVNILDDITATAVSSLSNIISNNAAVSSQQNIVSNDASIGLEEICLEFEEENKVAEISNASNTPTQIASNTSTQNSRFGDIFNRLKKQFATVSNSFGSSLSNGIPNRTKDNTIITEKIIKQIDVCFSKLLNVAQKNNTDLSDLLNIEI
jgi:hypothetical protein